MKRVRQELIIHEFLACTNLKGRLSNLTDEVQKQGFDIYSAEERGDFTFIEAREL
jgi:hypothetical protein